MEKTLILLISAVPLLWLSLRLMKRSRSPRHSDQSDYEDDEAAPFSSSLPPVREDGFQYDVFLSFRGPDTRKGFTSHLYQALQDKGIVTFIDNKELEKGQKVEELSGYIEKSKIFVPIFSKGYADSKWCLKEITKMVECKRLIIPVFFDIEPRDVRGQSGHFEPAFTRYDENDKTNKEEVRKWRNALIEAGKVSGYVLAGTNGSEARLIKLIVKRILTEVNKTPLFVAKHPIGLDSRVAEFVEMLKVQAQNDVKMVGIHGMGGIGKTTLARAVYNQICPHFDASSFISNVREAAKQPSGLVSLQEQLLHDVFKDEKVKVNDTAHGISMIMERIKKKKVLLVLDDVDSKPQLDALAGGVDWFCSGSRIIITTRDKRVLLGPLRVETLYELKVLDDIQSLQLFCWHAFGKEEPLPESAELSKKVADTAVGLPLALEIFGSHFFCLETNKEREDMWKKLKKDPDEDIYKRLKISFDALDKDEKTVFLDIACFFIGKDKNFATFKWKDISPDLIIKFLMHKSLININEDTGEFEMHDHIRDMGRRIVEDQNPSDPGMRSRLWKKDDILHVLRNKRGQEKIEAIDMSCLSIDLVDVDAESFAGMSQLTMLRLGKMTLGGEYGQLPRTLKWLNWNPQYLDSLPSTLPLENIVVLDLSKSSVTHVWNNHGFKEAKGFGQLKVLNLSSCWNLTITPDFKCMPNIEKLNFSCCEKLTELHPSIGHLNSLTHLSLRGCKLLKELPEGIWQLRALKELDVSFCSQITTLSSQLLDSKSLKWPLLGKLRVMNLGYCKNLTIFPDFTCMPYIEKLNFSYCDKVTELHPSIGHLKSLTHLSLRGCKSLKELPEGVGQLTSLEELDLCYCSQITVLPSLMMDSKSSKQPLLVQLKVLNLSYCYNLTSCPDFTCMPYIEVLDFSYCGKLTELHPSIGHLMKLTRLVLEGCESLKELPEGVWKLISLEELDVRECSQITTLSSQLLDSKSLKRPLLGKIRVLNLYSCMNLTNCPDFTCMPYIEKLNFSYCGKLTELHPSIGNLKSLTHLSLSWCSSLKELPEGVWQLTSLEELDVRECSQITTLSSQLLDSKSLKRPLLGKLRVMNLYSCMNLTSCPDFTCMPYIEKLNFSCCKKLTEVHPSIGHLKSLTRLNLSWCSSLKELSEGVWQLTALEELDASFCSQITTLSSQLLDSKSMKWPLLRKLRVMNLDYCKNLTSCPDFTCMPYIEKLDFSYCKKLAELHPSIGHLKNLTHLDLSRTAMKELPCSFTSLEKLECLLVADCKRLKFLPPLPPSLTILEAKCCYELEVIADVSNAEKIQEMDLSSCKNLVDVIGIEQLRHLKTLNLGGCRSLSYSLKARVEEANFHLLEGFTSPESVDESSDASAESSDA